MATAEINLDHYYNQFIKQSFEGITIVDENGIVVEWNPAMEKIYNINSSDVIGKRWDTVPAKAFFNAKDPQSKIYYKNIMEDILQSGESPLVNVPVNIEIQDIVGEKKVIQQVIFHIKAQDGFLIGVVARDITDQKKTEKEIIDEKEKAEERDLLKSLFLANVSHELRTAMNGIIGFVDLIDDPAGNEEEKKKYLHLIKENSEHLLSVITDVVDISLLESGQMRIHPYKFDLHQLLDDLFSSFQRELLIKGKSDVKIFLTKESNQAQFKIRADEIRLRQVLTNLMRNAVEYTTEGSIEFGYRINDDNLIFFVRDTGAGIQPEKQLTIFDRFRLADENNATKYSGVGLGLSISKGIVDLMDGRIWLESSGDRGVTFYFTLSSSVIISSESDSKRTINTNNHYSWSDKKILIVEDVDYNYQLIIEILKGTQVKYQVALDGAQAIDLCKKNSDIDLVLMDLQLPGVGGYEATKVIKKIRPDLPVIAQTAFAQQNDREKALAAGCDEYIAKPFTVSQLLSVIAKFI